MFSDIHRPGRYRAAVKSYIMANARKTFVQTYPDHEEVLGFIKSGRLNIGHYKEGFIGSLARAFDTYGKLTENQVNAVRKCIRQREERRAEWADQRAALDAKRQHLGTVGEKITLTLTVVHTVAMTTQYGLNILHICHDADQNVVIYKGTAANFPGKGETATVTATVKEHGVREGVKQTVIQRPKVI